MTGVLEYFQTELFKLNRKDLENAFKNLNVFQYEVHFGNGIKKLIPEETSRFWHVVDLLRTNGINATMGGQEKKRRIFTCKKFRPFTLFAYYIKKEEFKIVLSEPTTKTLSPTNTDDFLVFKRLLYLEMKNKTKEPLVLEGWRIHDKSKPMEISSRKDPSDLASYIKVFASVEIKLKRFGSDYFLAILPQSKISYEKNIDYLTRNQILKTSEISKFPYIRFPWGSTARFVDLLDVTIEDIIEEEPILYGRSFKDFAKLMYPSLTLERKDSKLALLGRGRGTSLFSSEAIFPSLNFLSIKQLDQAYFARLISKLKLNSAKRLDEAVDWVRRITPLSIGDKSINVEFIPHERMALQEPIRSEDLNGQFEAPGGRFAAPPVSFRKINNEGGKYEEFDVYPGFSKYQGTVNDLLKNPELKPLDVPNEVNIIAFVQEDLKYDWEILLNSLKEGINERGYRGWCTFGEKLNCRTHLISDFFSSEFEKKLEDLKSENFNCAVIVIPRLLETVEKTRRIYTETKTKIMRKGIPTQVITNDERQTENRDRTLRGKSRDSRVVFGIAINIIAKVGCTLLALSNDFARTMIPDSLIIGYNVARVFPPIKTPSELLRRKRKSVPLAAPLVIFDNRGANVYHQNVLRLSKETSLFSQYGEDIMSNIPKEIDTIIVHKDGKFSSDELSSLKKLEGTNQQIIPISIIRNSVPRIFNRNYNGTGFQLKSGTFLALSDQDFIMTTTPTTRWKPELRGWPSPILIKIHSKKNEKKLDGTTKLKLLYQIYALTKMQIGSQLPIRLPISIHYSNMIARFLRKVGDPSPDYLPYFVRPTEKKKHIPRWYI